MTLGLILCIFLLALSCFGLAGRVEKLEDINRIRKTKGDK